MQLNVKKCFLKKALVRSENKGGLGENKGQTHFTEVNKGHCSSIKTIIMFKTLCSLHNSADVLIISNIRRPNHLNCFHHTVLYRKADIHCSEDTPFVVRLKGVRMSLTKEHRGKALVSSCSIHTGSWLHKIYVPIK